MNKDGPDYSKNGKRSKRKGNTYERRCAKLLMEFTSVNFRRVPASGGFNKHSGATIREELFCGDLICDNPNFLFCVEAKNRKSYSLEAVIKSPATAELTKWWLQCVNDANTAKLLPLMFFKPNRSDDFIAVCDEGYNILVRECPSIPHIRLRAFREPLDIKYKNNRVVETITIKLPEPIIIDWKAISEHCTGSDMFARSE